jgi:hypothetical protein
MDYFVVVRSENAAHMSDDLPWLPKRERVDLDADDVATIAALPDLGLKNGSVWGWDVLALP